MPLKKNWAWCYDKLKHVISDNAITLCNSLTTVIKAKIFNYSLLHAEHTSTQRLTHLCFSYQNSCSRCFAVVLIPSGLSLSCPILFLKCSCPEYRTLTPSAWDSRPACDLPSDFVVEKKLRFYWPHIISLNLSKQWFCTCWKKMSNSYRERWDNTSDQFVKLVSSVVPKLEENHWVKNHKVHLIQTEA